MRNCIGQGSICTIYTDHGPIYLPVALQWTKRRAWKPPKRRGFLTQLWNQIIKGHFVCMSMEGQFTKVRFYWRRLHGSARPPVGVRGMYQSESNNTHIDGSQSFVWGAFPHHLNEVSPGRAVLFLTWRTPLRYRLGKAIGRQKSHFLPFPNLYRQAYYNHNRELRNMYYHIP